MMRNYNDIPEISRRFPVGQMNTYKTNLLPSYDPKEIGCFSNDDEGQFQNTKEQLKFFIPPTDLNRVCYDLNEGYDVFIKKDESIKGYIDDVLRWSLANMEDSKHLNTDFICWRGLLRRLLCTPFENQDGWIISVTKFNNTWYMCEFDTEKKESERFTTDERSNKMCYMGWKFEQFLVSDAPDKQPDTSKPVNNKAAFCSVVRSNVDQHSLLFAGEADCAMVKNPADRSRSYLELKTTYEFKHAGQEMSFKRFKLLKFWAQSFLVGTRNVLVGFKDSNGVVRRLINLKTDDMPILAQDVRNPWSPETCVAFLNGFLNHVKQTAVADDPRACYVFKWEPGQDVTSTFHQGKSQYSFLPDWYIEKRQ